MFVMVICVSVILPLNFLGTLQGNETDFGHTTLANLEANRDVLWAHITLSFLLFPVAIIVMRRFSVDVQFQEVGLEMRKTLMIEKVPKVEQADKFKASKIACFDLLFSSTCVMRRLFERILLTLTKTLCRLPKSLLPMTSASCK